MYGDLIALTCAAEVTNAKSGLLNGQENGNHAIFLDAFTGHSSSNPRWRDKPP